MKRMDTLKKPFKTSQVRWRVGKVTKDKTKGMALAYVDARDVQDRLDDTVGADGWSTKYEYHGKTCVCYLTIGDTTKADGAPETNIEGEKGALSKSFVRAASAWGIGRYLYSTPTTWVKLDNYKNIDKSEYSKLDKVHDNLIKGVVTKSEKKKEEPKKPLTDDELFDVLRGNAMKAKTVEDLDKFFTSKKIVDGVSKRGGNFIADVARLVSQRKEELDVC